MKAALTRRMAIFLTLAVLGGPSAISSPATSAEILDAVKANDYPLLLSLYGEGWEPAEEDAPTSEDIRWMQEIFEAAKAHLRSTVGKRCRLQGKGLRYGLYTVASFDGTTVSLTRTRKGEEPVAAIEATHLSPKILVELAGKHMGRGKTSCSKYSHFMLWHADVRSARRWLHHAKREGEDVTRLEQLIKSRTSRPSQQQDGTRSTNSRKPGKDANDTASNGSKPSRSERMRARVDREWFTVPADEKGRKKLLARWDKKILRRVNCIGEQTIDRDVRRRRVVVDLSVRNNSKGPLDFSSAADRARDLGVIPRGKTAKARIMDCHTATITDLADRIRYQWTVRNPRTEILFSVTSEAGKKLWLRFLIEVAILADENAPESVGWPKTQYPNVRLALAPQDINVGTAKQQLSPIDAEKGRGRGRTSAIVETQRSNWGRVNRTIGTNLTVYESKHFLIYTDFPNRKQIADGCERIYRGLRKAFGLGRKEQVWEGKCAMFLFQNREDFLRFAKRVDKSSASKCSGYFKQDEVGVHVAIPQPTLAVDREKEKHLVTTVVHELGHACLEAYCGEGNASIWLHEGVAQWCELLYDPHWEGILGHKESVREGVLRGSKPRSFSQMIALESMSGDDHQSYAMAWSMVDFMINGTGRAGQFRKLLKLTKKGEDDREAIETAFRMDLSDLERHWLRYVKSRY